MSKVVVLGAMMMAFGVSSVTAAHADPAGVVDHGNGCVVDPGDARVTVDSLRWRCTAQQNEAIYQAASAGAVPAGVHDGWVTASSTPVEPVAAAVWIGKTFHTGPDGGRVLNRVTGAGYEAVPADVFRGPSLVDGDTSWVLDYAPSVAAPAYDEVREVAPGVWLGHTWWRGAEQPARLLSFVLA